MDLVKRLEFPGDMGLFFKEALSVSVGCFDVSADLTIIYMEIKPTDVSGKEFLRPGCRDSCGSTDVGRTVFGTACYHFLHFLGLI